MAMDRLAPALITAALLLGGGPALWYEMKARERLSAEGEKHPWRVYWLGTLAGRQAFTDEGWRFHVRAVRFEIFGLVLVIVVVVLLFW